MAFENRDVRDTLQSIDERLEALEMRKRDMWDVVGAMAIAILVVVVGIIATMSTLRVHEAATVAEEELNSLELRLELLRGELEHEVLNRERDAALIDLFYEKLASNDPSQLRVASNMLSVFDPSIRGNLAWMLSTVEDAPEGIRENARRIARSAYARGLTNSFFQYADDIDGIDIVYDPDVPETKRLAEEVLSHFQERGVGVAFRTATDLPFDVEGAIDRDVDIGIFGMVGFVGALERYLEFTFPQYHVASFRPQASYLPGLTTRDGARPIYILIHSAPFQSP